MDEERPPNGGTAAADRGARRVLRFAAFVAVLAATVTAFGLAGRSAPPGPHLWWFAIALAFAATETFPVHFEYRREAHSFSLSTVPLIVGLFTVAPVAVVAARLTGSALALVLHRRQVNHKLVANLASFWLESAVAALVFHALLPSDPSRLPAWGAAFAAAIATDLLGTLVITGAISLYEQRWEPGMLSSVLVGTVAVLADTSVALVAVTLLRAQPAAVALLAVVAPILLLSYRAHAALRSRHAILEQLHQFVERLGGAVHDQATAAILLGQVRELMHGEATWLYVQRGDRWWRAELVADHAVGLEPVEPAGLDRQLIDAAGAADGTVVDVAPGHPLAAMVAAAGFQHVLAVSLGGARSSPGTLVVADRSGDVRSFDADDVRFLATLAHHAAVSLENGWLVERLRDEAARNEHLSLHDALTGLPNRARFANELDERLRLGRAVGVLLLDLDRFKEVNDTLGHHNGDVLLGEAGRRLLAAARATDVVARLGGDEFAVLLDGVDSADAAMAQARALASLLDQPFTLGAVAVDVAASIGIALSPGHGVDSATLLRRADVAMYHAKADRSGVAVYRPERDDYSPTRLALVPDLRRALERDGLEVHFQPQVDLRTGAVIGAEALMRWFDPARGFVPPDEFILVAERTDLIRPLTSLALRQAVRAAARWRQAGLPLRVSVNLSARSLVDTLPGDVARLLEEFSLPASSLCLELTETSIMLDPHRTASVLDVVHAMGIAVAIDDFGTGYSSLAYLNRLPVDEVKIDKSFVLAMTDDPGAAAIVRSVIDLGTSLNLVVVAEGIETPAVESALLRLGCHAGQGFLYRPAVPADEFVAWAVERASSLVGGAPADRSSRT